MATDLLPLLNDELEDDEMREWLNHLRDRLEWLSCDSEQAGARKLNIEEVFHYAHFDIESHLLQQHLVDIGREGGPAATALKIQQWLSSLEDALRDVILNNQTAANLTPILHWANAVGADDTVLTFNYDSLVELALTKLGKLWNHGIGQDENVGIPVCKLHGSIDWIVAHRDIPSNKLDLIFEKRNTNRPSGNTGNVEDDYFLWRCQSPDQLSTWMQGRDLQLLPKGAMPSRVGIAGLGTYKPLHKIPGLGPVWAKGMRSLFNADRAIIIGFSMSDFDVMAQMQFAGVVRKRRQEGKPLRVTIVNPCIDDAMKQRFRRVFREADFVERRHEEVNWHDI